MVRASDVKSYTRREGYRVADAPKPAKKLAAKKGSKKDETTTKKVDDAAAAKAAEQAKAAEEKLKAVLADVKKATTPQLEAIVDEHDLGISLSRLRTVADRRTAVTKALKAKVEKG